jgi:glutaredoxin
MKIILYSTSWCGFCHAEADWLEDSGIEFETKDIEADLTAKEELLKKLNNNFQGVPVTDVDGEIVVGFDRKKLKSLIGIK